MPTAPLGLLDISMITTTLTDLLTDAKENSPLWNPAGLAVNPGPAFTIEVTGLSPEEVRELGHCQVSLYLYHVEEDKLQRNREPVGRIGGLPPVRYSPLCVNLYYLLTAHSKGSFAEEQKAISIAMRCLHDNPIIKLKNIKVEGQNVDSEFAIVMETLTADELSRLWQAFTIPLRLSAAYKASVVLISPEKVAGPPQPKPTHWSITADPAALPLADGQVIGTARTFQYRKPDGTMSPPVDLSPARVVSDQLLFLFGQKLGVAGSSDHIYLLLPGKVQLDITGWTAAAALQTASRFVLHAPNSVGALATDSPPPGVYQICVGDGGTLRSNSTPFSMAPAVTVGLNPPLLVPVGLTFTMDGLGFIAGSTEVLLETVALAEAAPAPGNFQVNALGTQITFQAPNPIPTGRYAVRIRVNHVESDPSWWVDL